MARRRSILRDQWRKVIFHTDALTLAERMVCLALAEHMASGGVVKVNRQVIADMLGWDTKQRVTDRLGAAVKAGYLSKIDGGSNGVPARYQAMIPKADRVWLAQQGMPADPDPQVPRGGVPREGGQVTGDGVPGTGYQYARASTQQHQRG